MSASREYAFASTSLELTETRVISPAAAETEDTDPGSEEAINAVSTTAAMALERILNSL
jgi:hypothetical protein